MIKDGLWLGVVVVGFAVAGLIPACDASAPQPVFCIFISPAVKWVP